MDHDSAARSHLQGALQTSEKYRFDPVIESTVGSFQPAFRNAHFMTLVSRYWPRNGLLKGIPYESRLFTVEPGTQLLGFCHWQPDRAACPTVIPIHGLEGCSESHYMRGIGEKAYRAGCNVIRMNQRTCGGTEHLTPTLYNGGLSSDYCAILQELASQDGFERLFLVGYSMGGNLVLKTAGELRGSLSALAGVIAVCPAIDPTVCFCELEEPRHWFYHRHLLTSLKARLCRKAALFPGKWDLTGLAGITRISDFDDQYTAPDGGYRGAADYYDRAGACHVIEEIEVPTLIITAKDDPLVPYAMFTTPPVQRQSHITLIAPTNGGHCGFFQWGRNGEDPYWAENRIVEFIKKTTTLSIVA